jgi:hypothetical protein
MMLDDLKGQAGAGHRIEHRRDPRARLGEGMAA